MEFKDYYETLGVTRDASRDDIKRAYRRLARKYHPDVSQEPDAEQRFKEINEANTVLQDPEKRSAYDALGGQWRAGEDFRPPPGRSEGGEAFHFSPEQAAEFSDFFSSLFGDAFRSGGSEPHPRRGHDQSLHIRIDLEDAFHGTTRQIRLETPEAGADGRILNKSRTLNVRIPPGVTQGQQIRLARQGATGILGGQPGDLYLEVTFNPHRLFTAEGKDIHLRLPIAPWEAALGATVSVPTLGGRVSLKIPPNSQSGQRLRLKGRGLPGAPPGDTLVLLDIVIPPANSEDAREAYRAMAERLHFNPRADMGA